MEQTMVKTESTAKDFFLWAGAMITLYASVVSLITLLFAYIDYAFPDALQYYVDPYSTGIRIAIATLIVLFPIFLVIMRVIRNDIAAYPSKIELWVRRWALYLTLFIAGATIAVDLITLINTFLGGEISTRFGLKVLVVLLVAGAGFLHFLADLRGYWNRFPSYAFSVGIGAGIVVLATVASGFLIMGSPTTVRMYRLDDQKVMDLQNIQWQVTNYWQQTQKLPETASALEDDITGFRMPVDAQTGTAYVYKKTGGLSFQLCATFNKESKNQNMAAPVKVGGVSDVWDHAAGAVCFDRTINPEILKPYPAF